MVLLLLPTRDDPAHAAKPGLQGEPSYCPASCLWVAASIWGSCSSCSDPSELRLALPSLTIPGSQERAKLSLHQQSWLSQGLRRADQKKRGPTESSLLPSRREVPLGVNHQPSWQWCCQVLYCILQLWPVPIISKQTCGHPLTKEIIDIPIQFYINPSICYLWISMDDNFP